MSPIVIGVLGLLILFLLMALGMPIAFALIFVGFAGFAIITGINSAFSMLGLVPYTSVASYVFTVLPVFLLMGEFTSISGLLRDTYSTMYKWLGHLPGGLAMASIGGCAGFAAVCGSSFATAATTTRVCLPEMIKYKYNPSFATGTLAAGGTLGILIPPSLVLIVYGMIAQESVGRLFIAGIFPGIVLTLMMMLTIYIMCNHNPKLAPRGERTIWPERFKSLRQLWPVAILFLLVMGGIWGGFFTPTEAGAIGAFIAFIFVLIRKKFTKQNIGQSFLGVLKTSGMTYAMLIGAMVFTYFMSVSGLPKELASFVANLSVPSTIILIIILLVYIILGSIMDTLAMTLITLPIYLPLLSTLNIDLVWFGILMVVITELALITPPIGMNVFVISGMVKEVSMYAIFRGVFPFVIVMVIFMGILVAFPQISLFLPNTMMAMK